MHKFIVTAAVAVVGLAPLLSHAADYSRFEGKYVGVWDDTYDSCGDTDQDGEIIINLKSIDTDGTILNATVKYDDDAKIHATSGKVFKRNGRRRIRLSYGGDGYTYVIKAKLTDKKKIKGKYDHEYSGCEWGGTVNLAK